ncbi:MAG: hypothetical protein JXP72_05885, partial [Coriobacteriia bacterium]|nr:hypothetical protein [Coriobacteriia bacterium]
ITITRTMILVGAIAGALLLVFQILQGMRKIKFKGRLHLKVHKHAAFALVVVTVLLALTRLAYMNIIRF